MGSVAVASPPAGSGVKLDVATGATAELTFERGRTTTIALRYDDATGDQVR